MRYNLHLQADGAVASFFGRHAEQLLNTTGSAQLKTACYQSQIAQALEIKSRVEILRSSNSWGALVWQLNDVYPSGSWGSLEYGSLNRTGQVVGGRWRPLHYIMRREVWADSIASCGADGFCFVRSDGLHALHAAVLTLTVLNLGTGQKTIALTKRDIELGVGAGQLQRFCLAGEVRSGRCTPLQQALTSMGHGGCWEDGAPRPAHCVLEVEVRHHACSSGGVLL